MTLWRHIVVACTALAASLLICLTAASAAPDISAVVAQAPEQISEQTSEQITESPTAADVIDEKFNARAFWRNLDESKLKPITFKGGVRHPMLYFRQVANRRWSAGALFLFILTISAVLKIFLPALTSQVITRCRTNCFISLSSAFIYTCVLVTVMRVSFKSDDLAAMGIFCFGLLQFSWAMGACLGANLLAQKVYELLTRKSEPQGAIGRTLLYGGCLLLVTAVLTAISLIPNFGRLPRIGNRVVMLVAALGLGGLVNLAAGQQKNKV